MIIEDHVRQEIVNKKHLWRSFKALLETTAKWPAGQAWAGIVTRERGLVWKKLKANCQAL